MKLTLSQELLIKLSTLAAQRQCTEEAIVTEAVEQHLGLYEASYEEWFLAQVRDGIADADRGEFIEHEEVRRMVNAM